MLKKIFSFELIVGIFTLLQVTFRLKKGDTSGETPTPTLQFKRSEEEGIKTDRDDATTGSVYKSDGDAHPSFVSERTGDQKAATGDPRVTQRTGTGPHSDLPPSPLPTPVCGS